MNRAGGSCLHRLSWSGTPDRVYEVSHIFQRSDSQAPCPAVPRVPSAFKAQAGLSPAGARPAAPIPFPDVVQLAFPHLVDLGHRHGKTPGGGERDPGVSRTLDRFLRSVSFESLSARHPGPSWEPLRAPSSRHVNRESLTAQPSHNSSKEASALLRI